MHRLAAASSALCLFLLWGCSDQNVPLSSPHAGKDPLTTHAAQARADEAGCAVCHGDDYRGGSSGVSCFACHAEGPPFTLHPASWSNILQDHGTFPQAYSWTLCATASCHGTDLAGVDSLSIPSPACLSGSCHDIANTSPHALPFTDPVDHGAQAVDDLSYCHNCHGTPPNAFDGGYVAAPAILNVAEGACDGCHTDAGAHPTNWQGSNDAGGYPSSHRETPNAGIAACTLCHDYTGSTAPAPLGAPGCFSANFTNADASATACHPGGPGGHPLDELWLNPTLPTFHGDSDLTCSDCHDTSTECSTCHFGPSGSRSPNSWTHGESGHRSLEAYQTVCNTCHSLRRSYGLSPSSCHNCHGD